VIPVARERWPRTLDHRQDDLQRLVEPVEPVGEGAELEAQLVVLELEPAGADAEDRAPPADDIERRDDLCQQSITKTESNPPSSASWAWRMTVGKSSATGVP
jgi:hypothetical protein